MTLSRIRGNRCLLAAIVLAAAGLALAVLWKMAADHEHVGKGDFLAYWSAARLLRDRSDPYDPAAIMRTERHFTRSSFDTPITAANPPTLFVFMLPLAFLSFTEAKAAWLIINLALLLAASCLLAQIYGTSARKTLLVLGLFWAVFPQVLVGLLSGQVISLVLLSLVGCVLLVQKGRWFWAGASLVGTTVKPHMAVLAVPYLLLWMAHRRKWQGWLGLATASAVTMLILFAFRPAWLADMADFILHAPVWHWATPTAGGLMSALHVGEFWRCLVVGFLPLAWMWARPQANTPPRTAVSLLTVITVPTTFFGWSYDQTVLLIPIAEIINWLLTAARPSAKALVTVSLLLLIAANWAQRILVTSEMGYVWVPVAVAALYGAYTLESRLLRHEPSPELHLAGAEPPLPA